MRNFFLSCLLTTIWFHNNIITSATGNNHEKTTTTWTTLSNGESIPLVGLGVGNLQHELIPTVLESNWKEDGKEKIRLIDTARASRNEHIISNAVSTLSEERKGGQQETKEEEKNKDIIHIVTKVWYTHLGYERTKLSVTESLNDLSSSLINTNTQIHVHMLLHWPRCNDAIPWMNCEEEERNLPQYVKDAGPPPHLHKENAYMESWKALEDLYLDHKHPRRERESNPTIKLASIGVSNFELKDMERLLHNCQVKPHLYQGNVWSIMFDPYLMNLIHEHDILFQAYNVINGIWERKSIAPNAFNILTKVGSDLEARTKNNLRRIGEKKSTSTISEAMVIMSWLIQEDIAIIPRASSVNHQKQNSPNALKQVPLLSMEEKETVKNAMNALLKGEDLKVKATFQNSLSSGHLQVHWVSKENGKEFPVVEKIHPGEVHTIETHPGHTFAVYDETKEQRREFSVTALYGEKQFFSVDEF